MKKLLMVLILLAAVPVYSGTTVMQWGFDASSGNVTVPVNDDSGTGNDATNLLHGTAPVYSADIPTNTQFVTGIGSIDFTGTAGGLSTAASEGVGSGQGILAAADVAAAGGFTMEVWVKNAVDNSSSGPAFALNMFGGHCLGVSDTDEGVKIGYFHGDNSNDLLWTTDYTTSGSWTHLAVVLKTNDSDGKAFTEVTSYVNGTAIYTGSVTLPWWLDRATSVGNHQYGDWGDLEGLVYEPRITLGALSPTEFMHLTNDAAMPLPVDGDDNIVLDTNLQWNNPQAYTATQFGLHFRADDPNWPDTVNTAIVDPVTDLDLDGDPDTTEAAVPVTLDYETTYYWRVVSYEPNEVPGGDAIVHTGPTWNFTTKALDAPPVVDAGQNILAALDWVTAPSAVDLQGSVIDDGISSVTVAWEALEGEGIDPNNVTFTDVTDPATSVSITEVGTYTLKLTAIDGNGVEVTDQKEIGVYADACEAAKADGTWSPNFFDYDENCVVNLDDFAEFAKAWLDSTMLTEPFYFD